MVTRERGWRRPGLELFRMTWPMLFGVASLISFQLVDSAFIGQLGVDPLAALGFTVPVQQLIIGLQVGLGIATTAIISRVAGAGESGRARQLGTLVVLTGSVAMALVCLLLWVFRAPLVIRLGAEASLLPLVSAYWAPWLLSAWLGALLYFGYSICRAHGNTRLPGLFMVATSFLNLVLDPLFIFTFGWGMPGAAWATVISFGAGILAVYPALLARDWLKAGWTHVSVREELRRLLATAAPAALSQVMPPISAALATALVAGFGSAAVAAWGLGTRLEFFSIVVVLALTMSLPPMVGRLAGAGDCDGIRQLVRIATLFLLAWQLGIALLWLGLSGFVPGLLARDPAVAALVADYLTRVPLSYGGLGVCMLMVSVCNALGQPLNALLTSCLRLFACYLPALWVGSQLAGMTGVFWGALAGNLAAGFMAWRQYQRAFATVAKGSRRGASARA